MNNEKSMMQEVYLQLDTNATVFWIMLVTFGAYFMLRLIFIMKGHNNNGQDRPDEKDDHQPFEDFGI